jgi:hypothetical protein
MRRQLFNLLPWTSLILTLAIVALWVRSYVASDQVNCRHDPFFAMAETYGGVVEISLSEWMHFHVIPTGWHFSSLPYHVPYEYLAIHRQRPTQVHPGDWNRWLIVLPIWLFFVIPALPMGLWWYWKRANGPRPAPNGDPKKLARRNLLGRFFVVS